ncbi:hypothetical protein EVAR_32936_1 [Eumeta japonica]|uniref:Uncharacterized protein n=1 Tax=Eumeta variegata TaxID=151549 RepID=A0A4C1X6Y9_EUMVA|nr:hypothetical protein EVAR_32936_1 [Eumeta japonica]
MARRSTGPLVPYTIGQIKTLRILDRTLRRLAQVPDVVIALMTIDSFSGSQAVSGHRIRFAFRAPRSDIKELWDSIRSDCWNQHVRVIFNKIICSFSFFDLVTPSHCCMHTEREHRRGGRRGAGGAGGGGPLAPNGNRPVLAKTRECFR